MLEAIFATLSLGGRRILDRVSVQINAGEVVALIGPNGAGKSTLLKVLSGELKAERGRVALHGCPLNAWKPRELARYWAVLPQGARLDFSFSVLEVVLLGRSPHLDGWETPEDYDIARAALAAVDALHLEARRFPGLSGGERQRVQLARVLAQIWEAPVPGKARFLLLDEPTAALDPAHQHLTLELARKLVRAQGIGVLAVLHDLNLASQYADRILLLSAGRLLASGPPEHVFTPLTIAQGFGIRAVVLPHPDGFPVVLPRGIAVSLNHLSIPLP
jgi:iron complex transport system ATP-binding protein